MRKHTGERPYSCPHCPARFLHSYDLKNHMHLHTGDRPYECHLCHKAFAKEDHLQRHLKGQNCLEVRTRRRRKDDAPPHYPPPRPPRASTSPTATWTPSASLWPDSGSSQPLLALRSPPWGPLMTRRRRGHPVRRRPKVPWSPLREGRAAGLAQREAGPPLPSSGSGRDGQSRVGALGLPGFRDLPLPPRPPEPSSQFQAEKVLG